MITAPCRPSVMKSGLVFLLMVMPCGARVHGAGMEPVVSALKIQGHPRLLMTAGRLEEIKALKETDPHLKLLVENLIAGCDEMLPLPVVSHKITDGSLLTVSRTALGRMVNLSMAWLLTRNPEYKVRVIKEAEAAAAFEDWNPSHFLDVAEMTLGFALAYDWLYSDLSDSERSLLRDAIIKQGLRPGLEKYNKGDGWVVVTNNWNQVCNGGLTAGAIALLTEEPETAEAVLAAAINSAAHSKDAFAPDGVCVEGIGYAGYAREFGSVMYEALRLAFGADYGFSEGQGLKESVRVSDALLPNETAGFAQGFNFGDVGGIGRAYSGGDPVWYWFARRFGITDMLGSAAMNAEWLGNKLRVSHSTPVGIARLHALNLVWFTPHPSMPPDRPLDFLFRGPVPVVSMRSSWSEANATHLFLKGGDNRSNHGHLDLGSFEMIADGVKWAEDLGMDSYSLPGYFGKKEERAQIYRLSTLSHNTLVFDGTNQKLDGSAPVVAYATAPTFGVAVVDMTKAYTVPGMRSLLRGFLFDRKRVLVQDELDLDKPTAAVRWSLVTRAALSLKDTEATLTQDGKTLTLRLLSPPGAVFSEVSTRPPTPAENQNEGTRMVAVTLPSLSLGRHRIAVLLCPGESSSVPAPALRPLSDWVRSHPVKPVP